MSELKNTNGNSFSKFNKMSTEELDEILRLDFQLPDGEGLDEDTILYITEVIASREKSPSHALFLSNQLISQIESGTSIWSLCPNIS